MSKDVGELARFVLSRSDHTHPKENDTRKHRRSSAALECAARLAKAVFDLIQIAAPEIRLELLRGVPSYDGRLAIAYKSTWDVRKLAVQRMRGQHSRSHAHRIGPDVWDSAKRLRPDLKVPEHLGSARLPRTLNGWVEDILRDEAKLKDNAPTLWRWLKGRLQSHGQSTTIDQPKMTDPRGDAYMIAIEGHEERLSYIQFQKILTRARKPVKTLGELIGTVG